VGELFHQWFEKSPALLTNFSLLPFDSEKGQPTRKFSQNLHTLEFFEKYFHNHRVLQHKNLTGMVHFQTSIPWAFLKSARCPYFTWLKQCQVNLSPTKFKMDTLVACGFMVGAHPGFLSRNKAEEELCGSLSLDDEDVLPFQLSSHSISVPIKDGAGLTFMPS